jgi:hypothetical protein
MRHRNKNVRMRRRLLALASFAALTVGAGTFAFWVRLEHRPEAALAATRQYIAGTVAEERARRSSRPLAGAGEHDLEAGWSARLESCVTPVSFSPYQTNGNRLRRFLRGAEMDDNEVDVNFFDCSVRFYLRKQATGDWSVYRVQSHAG